MAICQFAKVSIEIGKLVNRHQFEWVSIQLGINPDWFQGKSVSSEMGTKINRSQVQWVSSSVGFEFC
jgi:uncharacterized protein (UPF0212 family)